MIKNLVKTFLIIFALIAAILANSAFAGEVKSTESKSSTVNANEDPDLKLSIEELKKKYPIDWLEKKYGKQDFEFCKGEEQSLPSIVNWPCGPLCSNFPDNANCSKSCYRSLSETNSLCSFFEKERHAKGAPTSGWLIKMDFFSESEIKSLLVEYVRQTIDSKNWKQSDWDNSDDRPQQFYGYVLYYFYDVNSNPTSEKEIKIKTFINSELFTSLLKSSVDCRYLKSVYRIKNLFCPLEVENKLSTTKSK